MNSVSIIGIVFAGAGAAVLAIAVFLWKQLERFDETALKAEGRVVDMVGAGRGLAPLVEFQDVSGRTRTFKHSISSSPPAYSIDQIVPVAYARDNPEDAKINTPVVRYGPIVAIAVVGSIFAIIGTLILLKGLSQ